MKMDLREFLLVFTMLWKMSSGLRCYKCKPEVQEYSDQPCEHFDFSDKYITTCEDSTMCYKREISSSVGNVKLYERDCAKQILNGDQVRTRTAWIPVKRIYEVYEEGCIESPQREDMVTKTVHCYCRGDLCNGAEIVNSIAPLLVTIASPLVNIAPPPINIAPPPINIALPPINIALPLVNIAPPLVNASGGAMLLMMVALLILGY